MELAEEKPVVLAAFGGKLYLFYQHAAYLSAKSLSLPPRIIPYFFVRSELKGFRGNGQAGYWWSRRQCSTFAAALLLVRHHQRRLVSPQQRKQMQRGRRRMHRHRTIPLLMPSIPKFRPQLIAVEAAAVRQLPQGVHAKTK